MMRFSKQFALLLPLVCASLVALAGAEASLRLLGPRETAYRVWRPGTKAEFEPSASFLPGTDSSTRFSINSLGFRGDELEGHSAATRILVLGGSTSEELYLDDDVTWPRQVQRTLNSIRTSRHVWVGSAGRSGLNARDHAVQAEKLLAQPPRIDLMLVFVGVNDLTTALAQGDAYRSPPSLHDPEAAAKQIGRAFAVVPGGLHESGLFLNDPAWKRTAIYQLLRRARMRVSSDEHLALDESGGTIERWRRHRRGARAIRETLPDLSAPLADYRTHLEHIITASADAGVPVVLMTQPYLWRAGLSEHEQRLLWLGGTGDFQRDSGAVYYAPEALAAAMDRFNETLLDVCAERAIPCLDLAARIPKDATHFNDDVHYTKIGSAAIAAAVADWLDGVLPQFFPLN